MSQPNVNLTVRDGALGILPSNAGRPLAVVGESSAGSVAVPSSFARVEDAVAAFERGPLVEAGAYAIQRYGRPVVFVRTGETTAGSYGSLTDGITGTSTPTIDSGTEPDDDYEVLIQFVAGGTIGTAGITYKESLDAGRTFSATKSLGTDESITIPDSGGITLDLGAGTIVAGDSVSFRANAPLWNGTQLTAALTALQNSAINWEICHVVGDIDAGAFDVIEASFAAMSAAKKNRSWIGNARMPNEGESAADYKTALEGIFGSKATTVGTMCAGAARTVSGVNGRQYRRPVSFIAAARVASVAEHVNVADVKLGALPGVSITDALGNPAEHNESVNPGLDDSRFLVLRTWERRQGVYINRPLILSAAGSDFDIIPHRRVMNLVLDTVYDYFVERLNDDVLVDADTGFILEAEAKSIESACNSRLSAAIAGPKATAAYVVLSRTDNLLSSKTFTGNAVLVPLAYPENANISVGFSNPALQVVAT
jgi:hypothetical protein